MSGGESILQAVQATRILGHIAADRAYRLRRGIGGVEVIRRRTRAVTSEIDDARLDDDAPIGQVHFEDAVHARQADDDAVGDGQRAAAQPRSRSARNKRNPLAMADAHDRLHLLRRSRQEHGARHHAEVCQAVAFIGMQIDGEGKQSALPGNRTQLLEDLNAQLAWSGGAPNRKSECEPYF